MKASFALLSNLLLMPTGTNFAASFVVPTKLERKVGQSAGRFSQSPVFNARNKASDVSDEAVMEDLRSRYGLELPAYIEMAAKAEERSIEFINSLKLDKDDFGTDGKDGALLPVNDDNDLYYLEDVGTLGDEITNGTTKQNVVLSKQVREFWNVCINETNTYHICARGSPGVGKSITFCYVIRSLLRSGKRVIYIYRTMKENNFHHVWQMGANGVVETTVYPENMDLYDVVFMATGTFWNNDPNTYYLCDVGKTNYYCDRTHVIGAGKSIICASADERHWGGDKFITYANGMLLTYPMMTKKQIFDAWDKFPGAENIDKQTLEDRHRKFGSIPRHLFCDSGEIQKLEVKQTTDLDLLVAKDVESILDRLVWLNRAEPRRSIMCDTGDVNGKFPFNRGKASLVSDLVQEKVARKHMKYFWNDWNDIALEDISSTRGRLFVAYVRFVFAEKVEEYKCRKACGWSGIVDLGTRAKTIQRFDDMIDACKDGAEETIFYSLNEGEAFVDFMYKSGGKYYAIKVTTAGKYDWDKQKLEGFLNELDLQEEEQLCLVNAVPESTFSEFVADPVDPINDLDEMSGKVEIILAALPKPALKSHRKRKRPQDQDNRSFKK